MAGKLLVIGAAAAAAIGAAAAGATAAVGGTSAQVQPVVFGAPLPLDPPPAPPAPNPAPEPAENPGPGQNLPSNQQVTDILTNLTNAGVSYKDKQNLVENGIASNDGHVLDHNLRKSYRDGELPYTFNVVNVAPSGPNQAVANVEISGPKMAPDTKPLMFVDQGGWVLTHDSAVELMQALAPH
ncbi:hypothetical protein ACAG26_27280 [Mycobacterium sp. pUA109]|uniref:hypothetical protein n=1 Tax=Mycobacterium sp. pUA109 TaxID=3238982 RepID=UPI00351B2998